MIDRIVRYFASRHVVVLTLKPGEAAVIIAHMMQAKQFWKDNPQYRAVYLEKAFDVARDQFMSQMTDGMAQDAAEDIEIAKAMGEYPS